MEGPLSVLLVEDDEVDVMNVERAFRQNEIVYPLYKAVNGLEALALLRSGDIPDQRRLILLDLNMPKMNGVEFLRELRADPQLKTIVVVVLTTSDEERDKVEAYNFNVAGYILKPVTFPKFVDLVARINQYWSLNQLP